MGISGIAARGCGVNRFCETYIIWQKPMAFRGDSLKNFLLLIAQLLTAKRSERGLFNIFLFDYVSHENWECKIKHEISLGGMNK